VKKLLLAKGVEPADIKTIEKKAKKEVDTAVEESKVRRGAQAPFLGAF